MPSRGRPRKYETQDERDQAEARRLAARALNPVEKMKRKLRNLRVSIPKLQAKLARNVDLKAQLELALGITEDEADDEADEAEDEAADDEAAED